MKRRRSVVAALTARPALVAVAVLVAGGPAAAQPASCPAGVISELEIRSLDPYDDDSSADEGAFDWAYRVLNRLHVATRDDVIRWELLFSEGSCFDPFRLSESERNLRSLPFLQSASITSERLADGTRRVAVVTRDGWAVSAGAGVDFDDGISLTGLQASHANALGSGLRVALFRRAFRERLRYGLLGRHRNLFGTGIDAVVQGGETRSGSFVDQALERPFLDEFGDHAFRQTFVRRDDYFGYALPPEVGFTPAYLRYRSERLELTYQARLGPPTGARAIVGVGVSSESFESPFGSGGFRSVGDDDFGESVTASDEVRSAIAGQAGTYSTKRLSLFLGMRDVRFERRGGLDAIRALQDVFVGHDLTLAVAPGFAVSDADRSDLLARLQGRFGRLGDGSYALARFDAHARRPRGNGPGPGGWRDVVGSLRVDGYWTYADRASLYLRARLAGGWRTDRPFQLRLGGREAVRAYAEDAFPGGRLVLLSAEQRFDLEALSPGFADLGAALFVDAGRMWAGDAPFGRDSGWESGVGMGLRASSAGARRVFRADLTVPLGHQRDARGIALRLYAEIAGVLDRRRWPDHLERSRWYGVDPDLSGRVPDPLARN